MVGANITRNKWQRLTITDDFIFGNVIQMGDNCLNLLRAILPELDLQKLSWSQTQKQVKDQYGMHGVRLDAFAKDPNGTVFDIEMQAEIEPALGFRVRYYQAKVDIDSLKEGHSYQDLSKCFVIFLMNYDHFGGGHYRYIFHNSKEDTLGLQLENGQTWMVLNSKGRIGNITPELKELFDLMNGVGKPKTKFIKQLVHDIERVKADPEKEREYMDLQMKLMDAEIKGKAEGKEEGKREGEIKGRREGEQLGIAKATYESALNVAGVLHTDGLGKNAIAEKLHRAFKKITDRDVDKILRTLDSSCKY